MTQLENILRTDNNTIRRAHEEALNKSKTYSDIFKKTIGEGSVTVEMFDNTKNKSPACWKGEDRKICIANDTDLHKVIGNFIFELTNAYQDKKFNKIYERAKRGEFRRGRFDIGGLNFAYEFEKIEYDGLKIHNTIIDEILSNEHSKELWDKNQIWTVIDFDDHFVHQLQHGHSKGYVRCYDTHYKNVVPWSTSHTLSIPSNKPNTFAFNNVFGLGFNSGFNFAASFGSGFEFNQ